MISFDAGSRLVGRGFQVLVSLQLCRISQIQISHFKQMSRHDAGSDVQLFLTDIRSEKELKKQEIITTLARSIPSVLISLSLHFTELLTKNKTKTKLNTTTPYNQNHLPQVSIWRHYHVCINTPKLSQVSTATSSLEQGATNNVDANSTTALCSKRKSDDAFLYYSNNLKKQTETPRFHHRTERLEYRLSQTHLLLWKMSWMS